MPKFTLRLPSLMCFQQVWFFSFLIAQKFFAICTSPLGLSYNVRLDNLHLLCRFPRERSERAVWMKRWRRFKFRQRCGIFRSFPIIMQLPTLTDWSDNRYLAIRWELLHSRIFLARRSFPIIMQILLCNINIIIVPGKRFVTAYRRFGAVNLFPNAIPIIIKPFRRQVNSHSMGKVDMGARNRLFCSDCATRPKHILSTYPDHLCGISEWSIPYIAEIFRYI